MNFTSGASSGTWTWDPGILTVTGCLSTNGTSCIAGESTSTTLIDDAFSAVAVGSLFSTGIQVGNVTGTYDSALAAYFGVPTSFTSPSPSGVVGELDTIPGLAAGGGQFNLAGGGNGDLTLEPTPEPATAILWPTGIGLLALLVRKRKARLAQLPL